MAAELREIAHRRAHTGEVAALPAQRIPRYVRPWPAGTQAGGGLVDPLRRLRVAQRISVVHQVDEALQQQAADDQIGQPDDHDPANTARRAPPDPAGEQPGQPPVQAAQAPPDQQEQAENQRRDEGLGHHERNAVVRHPHQLADLVLPVLPEPEGGGEQDRPGDEEDDPGPAPRAARAPIGESTPDGRGEHPEPITDGGGNATDDALDQAAAGKQRGGERQTRENEAAPAAWKGDIEQLPGFTGRWPRAGRRCHGRDGSSG